MTTTVSALVAVWNGAQYLREALASALAQTRPADEIIVVDDGSTDGSADIAEAMGVRVVREVHRGVAPTRNTALTFARGDLVAWLDADDRWTPDKLAVQVAYMDAHPDVGMTFTHQRLVVEPGTERPYWVRPEMLAGSSPVVGTCSMVVRRHHFDAVGGFDGTKTPSDDTDWIFRATGRGIAHVTLPDVLLERRVHAANLSTVKPLDRKLMLGMLRDSIARSRGGG